MTKHIIHISRDEVYLSRLSEYKTVDEQDRKGHYQVEIECTVPGGCGGWEDCTEDHEPGGDFGPYDAEEGAPWEGKDEFEFHGVVHTWRGWWGWTIPYEGCILRISSPELPDGIDTTRDSSWIVVDDWEGEDYYLILDREVEKSARPVQRAM